MHSQRAEELRATLTAYYTTHAPEEVDKVENLVARVVGGPPSEVGGMVLGGVLWTEEELYAKVEAKYGVAVTVAARRLTCLATDLDGTLLGSDHRVSDSSAACLQRLSAAGVRVVVATGRSLECVQEPLRGLGQLGGDGVAFVVFNGALARDESGADVVCNPVAWEVARATLEVARGLNKCVNWYTVDETLGCPSCEEHRLLYGRYTELTGTQFRHVECWEAALKAQTLPPLKVLVLCDEADRESTAAALRAGLPGGAEPSRVHLVHGQFFVEVLSPRATKAHALQALLGQDLSTVVAFGDADNDVEMLRSVGLGVAVRDATAAAKAAADKVSEWSNDDGAVAREVEALVRAGRFGDAVRAGF